MRSCSPNEASLISPTYDRAFKSAEQASCMQTPGGQVCTRHRWLNAHPELSTIGQACTSPIACHSFQTTMLPSPCRTTTDNAECWHNTLCRGIRDGEQGWTLEKTTDCRLRSCLSSCTPHQTAGQQGLPTFVSLKLSCAVFLRSAEMPATAAVAAAAAAVAGAGAGAAAADVRVGSMRYRCPAFRIASWSGMWPGGVSTARC